MGAHTVDVEVSRSALSDPGFNAYFKNHPEISGFGFNLATAVGNCIRGAAAVKNFLKRDDLLFAQNGFVLPPAFRDMSSEELGVAALDEWIPARAGFPRLNVALPPVDVSGGVTHVSPDQSGKFEISVLFDLETSKLHLVGAPGVRQPVRINRYVDLSDGDSAPKLVVVSSRHELSTELTLLEPITDPVLVGTSDGHFDGQHLFIDCDKHSSDPISEPALRLCLGEKAGILQCGPGVVEDELISQRALRRIYRAMSPECLVHRSEPSSPRIGSSFSLPAKPKL